MYFNFIIGLFIHFSCVVCMPPTRLSITTKTGAGMMCWKGRWLPVPKKQFNVLLISNKAKASATANIEPAPHSRAIAEKPNIEIDPES